MELGGSWKALRGATLLQDNGTVLPVLPRDVETTGRDLSTWWKGQGCSPGCPEQAHGGAEASVLLSLSSPASWSLGTHRLHHGPHGHSPVPTPSGRQTLLFQPPAVSSVTLLERLASEAASLPGGLSSVPAASAFQCPPPCGGQDTRWLAVTFKQDRDLLSAVLPHSPRPRAHCALQPARLHSPEPLGRIRCVRAEAGSSLGPGQMEQNNVSPQP